MRIDRREWLRIAAAAPVAGAISRFAAADQAAPVASAETLIARLIAEYSDQGFHRTGTSVDARSADWLSEQVRARGLTPEREPFSLDRIDPAPSTVTAGGRRVEGLPLFDCGLTGPAGVRGRLGPVSSGAEIGVTETAPNQADAGSLGDARRANVHKAIVCITRGQRPGLCPSNADAFVRPFGPPVLQVSSEEAAWLLEQAERGSEAQLVVNASRTPATAMNVTAAIEGRVPALAPVVVSTPRSGWYSCAAERGGGIVCWLEVMRALRASPPRRSTVFVAFSGHEVGSLGIHAFASRRPDILKTAAAWIHFGANIGGAAGPRITLAAYSDAFDQQATSAMRVVGVNVDQRIPRGRLPGGEAAVVHEAGGRYIALTGGNAFFHNQDDRGAQVVDPAVVARVISAFVPLATSLAAT